MTPNVEQRPTIPAESLSNLGTMQKLEIPVARMPTQGWVNIPVIIVHGARPGPSIWLSAALHGDELNGIEIVHRVCRSLNPKQVSGTIYACPILNVYGFLYQSRYLPDRRDLNRSFPGSAKGSLAGRIANFFMTEIVSRCEIGIDLHTAGENNSNLPHIRANLDDPDTEKLATAFGAPVVLHSSVRDGSLRHAAARRGKKTLVYESGGSKRFDRHGIEIGKAGIIRIMAKLGMLTSPSTQTVGASRVARRANWVRASTSGILHLSAELGQTISKGETLGEIVDSFGSQIRRIRASETGVVIGVRENPLVYRGDALVHIADCS